MQLLDNRYRDYVGFPPLLRSGENDGKSFSDFYRASQIELFSALDNALSQKAEDTLNQFAAVKKAEVNFQTSLGHRKGQLGINLIGAFAESQNHGIGWQVRVFGGEKSSKGANAGIFYRRFNGDILFGGNVFLDYEDNDLGTFSRYSIGGEAQNQYGSFAANYYIPLTDEKRKDGGVIFSRKGYDAKLRLNIPNAKFLKAAVDYYNFGDEHGAESDDGFRYGAEAHLIPGLRIALLYDNGEEELGGEVFYAHTIGEVQQSQTTNEQWTPDLFAAVSREHSQRIVSVGNASLPSPIFSASGDFAIFGTPATIGIISVFAGYFDNVEMINISVPPGLMTARNGAIIWNQVSQGAITFTIAVNGMPALRNTNLIITATGYREVERLANVNATLVVQTPIGDNILVSTANKILITFSVAIASYPFALTITQNLDGILAEVLPNTEGSFAVGNRHTVAEYSVFRRGAVAYTLTIVAGSEEVQSRIYEGEMGITMTIAVQSAMSFDMPGFLPPSFPQMPKLAFADPVILARRAGIQHTNAAACGGKGANALLFPVIPTKIPV